MHRPRFGIGLLMFATLLPGYVLCGMYWFEKVSWAPWNLVFPAPGPWGVFNLLDPFLAGITWIIPSVVVTGVLYALWLSFASVTAKAPQHR